MPDHALLKHYFPLLPLFLRPYWSAAYPTSLKHLLSPSYSRMALSDKPVACVWIPTDDVSFLLYFPVLLSIDIFRPQVQHKASYYDTDL